MNRAPGTGGAPELVQRWGGVLYCLMAALTRLPDMMDFLPGCPDRLQLSNYPVGGPAAGILPRHGGPRTATAVRTGHHGSACA